MTTKLYSMSNGLNPIRPGLFSRSPGPRGRGGEAQRPGCQKSKFFFQPIEMKRRMNHYKHRSISDAKFEAGSSSNFTTPQNFPWKKGMSHQIRLFIPGKQV